ncbi:MAG TPA: aldehyde dehydrogenase [Proteiniclasticum sp.]|uniref:aldehyde dehydrogenase family protein n=1 Tax=Proteiniclasticum sp. TaxID=2053595 RepID=UPI000E82626C|nr:aldehyde dehydrogenase family protein [Proteiniclasticum sp.]HBW14230.1 aldehyde dehydrogenase [Proteiniclasticum sp.]
MKSEGYKEWTKSEVETLLAEMKHIYGKGVLKNLTYRKRLLQRLKHVIRKYEKEIETALYSDLGKSSTEAFLTEIGILYSSIDHMMNNLESYAKARKAKKHVATIFSDGYIYREPYGVVLIISAFNYPFQLLMEPLIGAIAAGNVAVVKPSEQAVYTEELLEKIIREAFPSGIVRVVTGSKETVTNLTTSDFDYIFFTGSTSTGKAIMENAAKNLTPVTLELGGKSPALVMKRADVKNAAKKIVFGKFINAGQTCIAPDYVLVHKEVLKPFLLEVRKTLLKFYGEDPQKSKDYSRIINKHALKRLQEILSKDQDYIILGGKTDTLENYMEPTVLLHDSMSMEAMKEEIFGPILPIIVYEDINEALESIKPLGKPLAFYLFTEDKPLAEKILERMSFGGGCINDVLFHIATPHLPFGGVGPSGMGNYHGKYSFYTFTHKKAVLKSSSRLSMSINEPPMTGYKEKIIRMLLK